MTGFAAWLQDIRPGPEEGVSLGDVLGRGARSWWDADDTAEARRAALEERAEDHELRLAAARYVPGTTLGLAQRLNETQAQLAAERDRLEKARKAETRLCRMWENNQLSAWDFAQRHDALDLNNSQADKLQRRAESLQSQIAAAAGQITPVREQLREPDAVEAASRHARDVLKDIRQAAAGKSPAPSGPRPFASRGGAAVRSEVTCEECIKVGASPDESFIIHSDPSPLPVPDGWVPEDGNPYLARGHYDASDIVRGTEGAIMGLR
jgi:hypothetical protein